MSPRTGRPKSDNPLNYDIKVRVDDKTNKRVVEYAKRHGISRTETIRRAIYLFLDSEK